MGDNAWVVAGALSWGRRVAWARVGAGTLLAGLALLTLGLAWGSRGWPLVVDPPLMHYVAWRIAEGAVPYRDLFDMNFPGTYLLHRGVLALFGSGDLGWRVFDLAWLGGTAGVIAAYCRRFGAASAAAAALLFGAYHLAGGPWRAGQRDFFIVAPLLGAAHLVARFREEGRSLGALALAGLALGGAMTIKPHAGLFWLFLAVVAALGARRSGQPGWAALATVVGSGLLPPAAVALWLWQAGGLGPFLEILTRYLPLYAGLGRVSVVEALGWHPFGREILAVLGGITVVSLWGAPSGRRFGLRRGLLLAGLVYGALHYWLQGKGWEYHLDPLVGFTVPLAASWVDSTVAEGRRGSRAAILGGLLLVTGLLGAKGVGALDPPWVGERQRRVESLVRHLDGRVPRGGTVQVLDTTEGGIHALLTLGLRQPTRFIYDFHFFHDVGQPYIQALRAEFLRDLRRRPPEFLVVFEPGWPRGGFERLAGFQELADWIDAGYAPERESDGYRVYARRHDR